MIDYHCHLLPGVDDGPLQVDDSIAMAQVLVGFGYKAVCCTPHCIKGGYEQSAQHVREATLMLQADLDNADIALELRAGMEYCLDECFSEYADDLLPLGDTRLILCEAPQQAHPGFVQQGLELILEKGYVPLIAHPERTEHFYQMLSRDEEEGEGGGVRSEEAVADSGNESLSSSLQPPASSSLWQRLWPFTSRAPRPASRTENSSLIAHRSALPPPPGCLFHANLGSFTGFYGDQVQRRAYELLKRGAYTCFASDLHDSRSAKQVLMREKIVANPMLTQLACWDGKITPIAPDGTPGAQIDLF